MHTSFARASMPLVFAAPLLACAAGCATSTHARHEREALHLHADWLADRWNRCECTAGSGLAPQPAHALTIRSVNLEDPLDVADALFASLPVECTVHPTENYFYFEFTEGARRIGGNFRFVDVDNGTLSIGYFDRLDPRFLRSTNLLADAQWTASTAQVTGGQTVSITHSGVTKRFFLPTYAMEQGCNDETLPGEEFVSGVLDESGVFMRLLWCERIGQFAFVRTDAFGPTDHWVPIAADGADFEFGRETRFLFYLERPSGRRVLVGVAEEEIRANSYFDGPFDQVPPHLPIRTKLERAYPYVLAAGGIDEHGNFLTQRGSRVAITPYNQYAEGVEDLARSLATQVDSSASGQEQWARLAWDRKQTAHLNRPQGEHQIVFSRTWPANHYLQFSLNWPASHAAETSRGAKPNAPFPQPR